MEDEERLPLLDALLAGKKLWSPWLPAAVQVKKIKKVLAQLQKEHTILLEEEPEDEFHACVVLGAMNLVEALLTDQPIFDIGGLE